MSKNIKKIEIDGDSFIMKRLPANESMLLQMRLISVFGSMINSELADMGEIDTDNVGAILDLIGRSSVNIDPEKMSKLIVDMCEMTSISTGNATQSVDFNLHITDLMTAYKLAFEFVKFEYANFIESISQRITQ